MPRKSADQWFAEYGESHQNPTNEVIHWICVPLIFFSVLGFVWEIPISESWEATVPWFNWTLVVIAAVTLFYVRLSLPLAVGMLAFMTICQTGHLRIDMYSPWPVWQVCLVVFIAAWIGQFIGHKIERKKPSFLKDVQFLLIGPAWLLSKVYRKIRLKY